MDEDFYNGGEHLEHTYKILRAEFHPPFWFFANVDRSEELLGDEPWAVTQSLIASRVDQAGAMPCFRRSTAGRWGESLWPGRGQ